MLGDPVEHSLSPLLHGTALRHSGLTGTYEARRVDSAGMKEAVDAIRRGELDGASVTMPHKGLAHDLSDRLSDDAARTHAVNTLVRVDGEIIGHNTDVAGVRTAWSWAGLPERAPVVLYGAGGAAAGALVALEHRQVVVCARRLEAAEELVSEVGTGTPHPWQPPGRPSVLVNATPLGMRGEPMGDGFLDDAVGVFDMAYGSGTTPTVRLARETGLPVAEGVDLLVGQAIVSFWLWTGRRAPVEAMRAVASAAVEARA